MGDEARPVDGTEDEMDDEDILVSSEMAQALEDSGAELDALLDELGDDVVESSQQPDEETTEFDSDEDEFGELTTLPEMDDELDLSTVEMGDEAAVETHTDEPEQQELLSEADIPELEPTEESMSSDPLAEVAAIAAERNAEAAKQRSEKSGKMLQIALAGVALLALVAAGFAAWQASSASSRLDEIAMSIAALQQGKGAAKSDNSGNGEALRADLDKLMAQVNEVAATLDGSLVDMREQNQATLDSMAQRLDTLEKREVTAPVTAIKPLVEKSPTIAASETSTGGWSVNLISLSNEKVADEELARLRNLGIRAEKQRVEQDGRVWYRLRVPGFTSHDGARAYIATVESKAGVSNAWVGKN